MGKIFATVVFGYVHLSLVFAVQTASAQTAETLLARDLKAGMKTMVKDVRIYHYFNLAQVYDEFKNPAGRNAFVRRQVEHVTGQFWDLNFHANEYINAGPGVYLAIDPHISGPDGPRSFGNTMIELQVPRGTPYLNVVRAIPVAADTLKALVSEGIIASHQQTTLFFKAAGPTKLGFYRDTLKTMTDPGFETFRSLVQRVLVANQIQFIEFNWNTSLAGFCNKTSYSSFNYIGTRPSDGRYNNIPMISSLPFPQLTGEETEIATRTAKFRSVLEQLEQLKKRGLKVPRDFGLSYYSAAEFKQIKDMTFSCE